MRRAGELLPQIAQRSNLELALYLARKGRKRRATERLFLCERAREVPSACPHDGESIIQQLQSELLSDNCRVGSYRRFVVCDPKRRVIHAAPFRDRVLHHAIMNIVGPLLDRRAIFDSYACRKGKGAHAARERAQSFSRRFECFAVLDIRKYFDSVRHDLLLSQFERIIKDEALLQLLHDIVRSYETAPDRGLPIGSLVSQHAANAFLEPIDRFIKERLPARGYVRYMDDLVIWHDQREVLADWCFRVHERLRSLLDLEFKTVRCGRTRDGLHYLGVRIVPEAVYPDARARRRLVRKLKCYEACYQRGTMTGLELQRRASSLLAALGRTGCSEWRRVHLPQGNDA